MHFCFLVFYAKEINYTLYYYDKIMKSQSCYIDGVNHIWPFW